MGERGLGGLRQPLVCRLNPASNREVARDRPDDDEQQDDPDRGEDPAPPAPFLRPLRSRRLGRPVVLLPPEGQARLPLATPVAAQVVGEGGDLPLEASPAVDPIGLLSAGGRHSAGYGSRRGGSRSRHRRRSRRHQDPGRSGRAGGEDPAAIGVPDARRLAGGAARGARRDRHRAPRRARRRASARLRHSLPDRPGARARRLLDEPPAGRSRFSEPDAGAIRPPGRDRQRLPSGTSPPAAARATSSCSRWGPESEAG